MNELNSIGIEYGSIDDGVVYPYLFSNYTLPVIPEPPTEVDLLENKVNSNVLNISNYIGILENKVDYNDLNISNYVNRIYYDYEDFFYNFGVLEDKMGYNDHMDRINNENMSNYVYTLENKVDYNDLNISNYVYYNDLNISNIVKIIYTDYQDLYYNVEILNDKMGHNDYMDYVNDTNMSNYVYTFEDKYNNISNFVELLDIKVDNNFFTYLDSLTILENDIITLNDIKLDKNNIDIIENVEIIDINTSNFLYKYLFDDIKCRHHPHPFVEWNIDVLDYEAKTLNERVKDLEIGSLISAAQSAYTISKSAYRKLKRRFGARIADALGLENYIGLEKPEINDDTIQEILDEMDNLTDIYRYNTTEGGINGDLYVKNNIYIDAGSIVSPLDPVLITQDINTNLGIFTGGTKITDLLYTKTNNPVKRVKVVGTSKYELQLDYDDTIFEAPSATYKLTLKNDGINAEKLNLITNGILYNNTNKLDIRFNTIEFEKDVNNKLSLKDEGVYANKIKLMATNPIIKNNANALDIGYDTTIFKNTTGKLDLVDDGINASKLKYDISIFKNTTGKLDLLDDGINVSKLKYDISIFKNTTGKLDLVDNGITGAKLKFVATNPIIYNNIDTIDIRYETSIFQNTSGKLDIIDNSLTASKIKFAPNRPIYNPTTTTNIDFRYDTTYFTIKGPEATQSQSYALTLINDGIDATKLKYDTGIFKNTTGKLDLNDNGINAEKINFDSTGILYNNINKLDIRYDTGIFEKDISNKLSLKDNGINATKLNLIATNPIIYNNVNSLDIRYDTGIFKNTLGKLDINDNGITANKISIDTNGGLDQTGGLGVKLADNSLSKSLTGLEVSSTYKTELTNLKNQAQTAKTGAETAKTGADASKAACQTSQTACQTAQTACQTAQTACQTSQTAAASSATASQTSATASASSATASAASAAESTTAAGASAASAVASAASATVAGGSATAAAGSAGAAIGAAAAAAASLIAIAATVDASVASGTANIWTMLHAMTETGTDNNSTDTIIAQQRLKIKDGLKIQKNTTSIIFSNDNDTFDPNYVQYMSFLDNSFVGIGTTPTQKLDVNGNVKALNFIGNGSQITNLNIGNIANLSSILNSSNEEIKNTSNFIITRPIQSHTHDYNSLTNKPTLFNGSYTALTDIPSTFAPSSHTHDYASSSHTHSISGIIDLSKILNSSNEEIKNTSNLIYNKNTFNNLIVNGTTANIPDLSINNMQIKSYNKSLGTTISDYTDICQIYTNYGAFTFQLDVIHSENGDSLSKSYICSVGWLSTNYYRLNPICSSGSYNGNDFAVDILPNGANTKLRLVRISGTTNSQNYTCILRYFKSNSNTTTITDLTATGTGATNIGIYKSTPLTQIEGKVGIGKTNPNYKLDVEGTINANLFVGDGSSLSNLNINKITNLQNILNSSNQEFKNTSNWIINNHISSHTHNISDILNLSTILNASNNHFINTSNWITNTKQNTLIAGTGITISNNTISSSSTSTSQWTTSSTNIYYTTGNVGIGLTNPTEKLQVTGNVKASYFIGDGSQITNYNYNNLTNKPTLFNGSYTALTDIPSTFTPSSHTHDYASSSHTHDYTTLTNLPFTYWYVTPLSTNIYNNSGKVGIGTDSAKCRLEVTDGTISGTPYADDTYSFRVRGDKAYIALFQHTNQTQGIGINYNTIFATGDNTDQNINLNARGNGNIVINSDLDMTRNKILLDKSYNPNWCIYVTDVNDNLGSWTGGIPILNAMRFRIPQTVGIGHNGFIFENSAEETVFEIRSDRLIQAWDMYINTIVIKNHLIEIGAITYPYPLFVNGTLGDVNIYETGNNYMTVGTGSGNDYNTTVIDDLGIYVTGSILATSKFAAISDIRIKKNIVDIDDDSALQKIMGIEPKIYNYIDNVKKTNSNVYGFIAQQIREIIPEATSLIKDFVPNVFSVANCNSNIILLTSNIDLYNISSNTIIKCMDENDKEYQYIVEDIISSNSFSINSNISSSNVFVYGTQVDDFHTLDKSYIFTLNVCATQSIARQMDIMSSNINLLTSRIQYLENIISSNI